MKSILNKIKIKLVSMKGNPLRLQNSQWPKMPDPFLPSSKMRSCADFVPLPSGDMLSKSKVCYSKSYNNCN